MCYSRIHRWAWIILSVYCLCDYEVTAMLRPCNSHIYKHRFILNNWADRSLKAILQETYWHYSVKSSIDGRALDGVPSIRVHNGTDYMGSCRFIRWTEVFILQVCCSIISLRKHSAVLQTAVAVKWNWKKYVIHGFITLQYNCRSVHQFHFIHMPVNSLVLHQNYFVRLLYVCQNCKNGICTFLKYLNQSAQRQCMEYLSGIKS